jgi:hypothetical protein
VKTTGTRPKITVSADGRGVVGHAGARLLADVADATGLTSAFGQALAGLRQRESGHAPGRVAVDLAVMLADGGQVIADLAVLRDQADLFGAVASDPTVSRVLSGVDTNALDRLRAARAAARELAWAQAAETRDGIPVSMAAGLAVPGLVLDLDASIVICHSDKDHATRTWKNSLNYEFWLVSVARPAMLVKVYAEVDGVVLGGELVELVEFLAGSGEADLESVDFAQPAFASGFVDAGEQVVADLLDAVAAGGLWPQEWAA